ncbi:hypothetical protein [Sphingobium yanoikuyae]|uniref:hypothetical protein n=1 Tax=Sphingobium yanoikuyae TaxID=13690 RepID=UPI0035B25B55
MGDGGIIIDWLRNQRDSAAILIQPARVPAHPVVMPIEQDELDGRRAVETLQEA